MIVKHKRNVKRTVRRVVIAMVVMVVLFMFGGVAYVYFTGRNPSESATTVPPVVEEASPLPKPVKPAANAGVGAAVNGMTSPVKPGTNASITVATTATAKCTIKVTYNNVDSNDSGLGPKTADDYGNATWTWTVTDTTPVGTWPIKVTCAYNGRSAVVEAKQVVAK